MPRGRGASTAGTGETMSVFYTALLWLVVAAHFAFLIYLPSGGFLALRWRRSIWLHVAVVLWGVGSVVLHFWCPLTGLEQWTRSRAGMPPLNSGGFIDHYVTGVMYPSGGTGYAQTAAFTAVLVSWFLYAMTARRRSVTDRERERVGAVVPHRGGTR